MKIDAKQLRGLADSANDHNKTLSEIVDFCKRCAEDGHYQNSFNNFKLDDGLTPHKLKLYLESLGFVVSDLNAYKQDETGIRVSFGVYWND